jgi:hypothetical protein
MFKFSKTGLEFEIGTLQGGLLRIIRPSHFIQMIKYVEIIDF